LDGYVYEAVYPRIKKTPYTEWLELHNYELKLIDYELINDPNELVGLRYDLGIFVNELCFYLTKLEYFTNRNDEKKYFCFELSAWCVGKKNSYKANGLTFDNRTN
jgi:hypothetical protein